jgi:hypothetical protein
MRAFDPSRPANPWRRLGRRLTVFCLPFVLGWVALEWWAEGVPNYYSLKRERLELLTNEVDTLLLGSSSVDHGVLPQMLSGSAFNLAFSSESLYETDCLATRVVPKLPKLKRVIININYQSLFFRMQESDRAARQYCYRQEWGIPPELARDRLDLRMWSRLALRTPRFYLSMLSEAIQGWIFNGKFACEPPEIDEMDNRGWGGRSFLGIEHPPAPELGRLVAKQALAEYNLDMKMENEPFNLASLDHLLSMLHQRKLQAVLVTVPVCQSFIEVMTPEFWNETLRVVAQRTNNVDVYFYSFLSMPQLEPQDFTDVFHLSPRGAARFTELLNSTLIQGKPNSETKTNKISANIVR